MQGKDGGGRERDRREYAVQRNVSIIQSEELCILELTMSSLASFPGLHIQYSM